MTDNASNCVNARDPDKHEELNFPINQTGSCVDHGIELAAEDAIKNSPKIKESLDRTRSFVNHMKDSSLAREELRKTIVALGEEPMSVIEGTMNRWFYKHAENKRMLLLKESVQHFLLIYDLPARSHLYRVRFAGV